MRSNLYAFKTQTETPGDPTWLYEPPYLDEYVESRNYLGYPPLSRGQRQDAIALLGENPKEIFSGGSIYTIAVNLWGKGSGKDYYAAILQSYVKQVVRMMRNPHSFFSMAPNEDISLINVSMTQDHAVNIYFKKFENCILANGWYRDKYSIYKGNSLVQIPGNIAGRPRLSIHAGEVYLSDYKLVSRSFGSDNESAEGGSPIWFTIDEASAMTKQTKLGNADKIYSTLRTSCASRFGKKWKGMIISYPRSEVDFTVRMYEQSQKESTDQYGNTIYGSKRETWNAREDGAFKLPPFQFEGMLIPGDFKDEFDLYPEESLQKFACRPPAVENPFITYPGRIFECVKTNRAPIFTTQDQEIQHIIKGTDEMKKYIGKIIDWIKDKSYTTLKTPRVIHVDGGLTNNRAALILAHGEPIEINIKNETGVLAPTYVNKVIVDAVLYWQPNKQLGLQVSLNNIETIIEELTTFLNIVCITYDQWNSQTSLETFQKQGLRALEHTISNDDYYELRSMIYAGGVELLPAEYNYGGIVSMNPAAGLLLTELKRLKLINGKVDHPAEREGGCFAPETKIALLSGQNVSIEEVVDMVERKKDVWTYSIDPILGTVIPKKIEKVFRNGIKKLIEVELDNGEKIRCTPNHRFMLRNGEYREASRLVTGDSLMPLYRRKDKHGYELVYDPALEAYEYTHKKFGGYTARGYVIHHANYIASDNRPTNLQNITSTKHRQIHNREQSSKERTKRKVSVKAWHIDKKYSIEYMERNAKLAGKDLRLYLMCRIIKIIARYGKNKFGKCSIHRTYDFVSVFPRVQKRIQHRTKPYADPLETNRKKSEASKRMHANNPELSRRIVSALKNGFKPKEHGKLISKLWADGNYSNRPPQSVDHRAKISDSLIGNTRRSDYAKRQKQIVNHKVAVVRDAGYDYTYDLQIDGSHNYSLAAGVFVHNSKDIADCLAGVNWSLNQPEQKKHNIGGFPKGLIGPSFTRAQPDPFSAASQGIPGGIEPIIGMSQGRTPAGGVPVGGFRPVDPRTGASGKPALNRPGNFPKGVVSSPGFNRGPSPGQRGTGAVPPYLL
jgi:intein/homing endonuclease